MTAPVAFTLATYKKGQSLLLHPVTLVKVAKRPGERQGWVTEMDGTHWVTEETDEPPVPGDVFFKPDAFDYPSRFNSRFASLARRPIFVVLPDGTERGQWWCVDELSSNDTREIEAGRKPQHDGWKVTQWKDGLEKLTVYPSIRTGVYHAMITDGIMVPYADSRV